MKFICVQPAIPYYTWQVEVMINNFIECGVNPQDIQIVCSYNITIPDIWIKLRNGYKNVNFYFYEDSRYKPSYISSIRPHILHKHWMKYPELEKEIIFYHDCDIIFTKQIDFKKLEQDNICYVSDTISYIGAHYIRSKGEHLFDIMINVVGVDKQFVIDNEKDSGGAQYILKGINSEFWNKVYWDSENMYKPIVKLQNGDHSNPFQIWCADMWSVLWNLWFFEKTVRVVKEMSFSWGTSNISEWDTHPIYHNAGVVGPDQKLFYKGQYQSQNPYNIKLEDFSNKSCSIKYVESILKTKEVTCLQTNKKFIKNKIVNSENPLEHWSDISNLKNKIVLDLGCGWINQDHQSTPEYFISRGASKIIGIDETLSEIKDLTNLYPNHIFICKKIENIDDLIALLVWFTPHVIKMDIEGFEILLKDIPNEYFNSVEEMAIEYHNPECKKVILDKFKELKFDVIALNSFGYYCTDSNIMGIIHAKKSTINV